MLHREQPHARLGRFTWGKLPGLGRVPVLRVSAMLRSELPGLEVHCALNWTHVEIQSSIDVNCHGCQLMLFRVREWGRMHWANTPEKGLFWMHACVCTQRASNYVGQDAILKTAVVQMNATLSQRCLSKPAQRVHWVKGLALLLSPPPAPCGTQVC